MSRAETPKRRAPARILFSELLPIQLGIRAVLLDERVVRALLGDATVRNDGDLVRVANGRESVCHDQRGAQQYARKEEKLFEILSHSTHL